MEIIAFTICAIIAALIITAIGLFQACLHEMRRMSGAAYAQIYATLCVACCIALVAFSILLTELL